MTARYCTKCVRIMRAAYPYTQPTADMVVVKDVKESPKAKVHEPKKEVKETKKGGELKAEDIEDIVETTSEPEAVPAS